MTKPDFTRQKEKSSLEELLAQIMESMVVKAIVAKPKWKLKTLISKTMSRGQIRNLESQFKTPGIAYLFWFFFGAHYIYMGRIGTQIFFWVTFGGLGLWALIDLFRIPGMVRSHNDTIAAKIDILESGDEERRHLAY